jgi:protein TonB
MTVTALTPPSSTHGAARLPATGMPVSRDDRRLWTVLSILLHLALIFLVTTDFASHERSDITEIAQGAGGAGPAGGGGGGKQGTGGIKERVTYVAMAPAPTPAVPREIPPVAKPLPPVVPPPTPPPQEIKPVEPIPAAKVDIQPAKIEAVAPVTGTGGGSGKDGTAGNGPGSGGGVGSGVGTGRGAGIGPGTGGGTQTNYPPTPTEMFIPPLPMPDKVRGFRLIAEYDVDSTGKVLDFNFTPTKDGGYNNRLKDVLRSFKFRPGTTPDGKPIRMKAQIVYEF